MEKMFDKLKEKKKEYKRLEKELSSPELLSDREKYRIKAKQYAGLKEMMAASDDDLRRFTGAFSKPIKIGDLEATLRQAIGGGSAKPPRPTADVPAAAASESDSAAGPYSGEILLADDYPTNRLVASMHLKAAGFSVDLVGDGRQAVAAFENKVYDLILMDIQMPVLNGFDATHEIRSLEAASQSERRVPIIALTANALKGDEQKCLEAGMDGYLTKPIHREQLIRTVADWLGQGGDPVSPVPAGELPESVQASLDDTTAVMDIATAVDEFGDADTVKIVAHQLIENVDRQLEQIRESIAAGDRERIRKEAHAIKGGAATMEAMALSQAAAHLENLSPEGAMDEIGAGYGTLEKQFCRFREFVSQWKEA